MESVVQDQAVNKNTMVPSAGGRRDWQHTLPRSNEGGYGEGGAGLEDANIPTKLSSVLI